MKRRGAPLDIMSASVSTPCNVIWAHTTQHSDSPGLQMRLFGVSLFGGSTRLQNLGS